MYFLASLYLPACVWQNNTGGFDNFSCRASIACSPYLSCRTVSVTLLVVCSCTPYRKVATPLLLDAVRGDGAGGPVMFQVHCYFDMSFPFSFSYAIFHLFSFFCLPLRMRLLANAASLSWLH